MNNDELEILIKSDNTTSPYIAYNTKKILQECKVQKNKRRIRSTRLTIYICCYALLCFSLAVVASFLISEHNASKLNVETENGVKPQASVVDNSNRHYVDKEHAALIWKSSFDRLIAWGPEFANSSIKLETIINSNIISELDKFTLLDYASSVHQIYPNYNVSFQIAFGIRNSKDYIMLIDSLEHNLSLGNDFNGIFIFESNLPYSFDLIRSEFETLCKTNISDDFLNASYYDNQKLLSSGIIISFIENDSSYKVYYIMKLDGYIYIINK